MSKFNSAPDYFQLLEIPRGVEVDEALLTKNYFAAQTKYHPDKNPSGAAVSGLVNEAYSTLKNKYRRLEYLLGDTKLEACASLLEEMLELRENPQAGIAKAKAEIEKLFSECASLYANNQAEKMAQNFVRIKYLRKFLEDAAANT